MDDGSRILLFVIIVFFCFAFCFAFYFAIKDIAEQDEVVEHAGGVYELDGDMQITDFAELLGRKVDELEIESVTVGGMTIELYGTFPDEGTVVSILNAKIQVLERDGLRVGRVLVTIESEAEVLV